MKDLFGRNISYLRLSVTDRCDFRCSYCLPRSHRDFSDMEEWLSPTEIHRIISIFVSMGVRHVRLTGGEPLVRKDLLEIASRLRSIKDLNEVSISTNAARLAPMAAQLREAGISRLNISLDTLDPTIFKSVTGGDLYKVLKGIDAAVEHGFHPVKINMVVMRGINDHEVVEMVEFCKDKGVTLRFIETMPVGLNGIEASQRLIPLAEIEQRLGEKYHLEPAAMKGSGPAKYFRIDESPLVVGFITPQSQHFCSSCNRVRLSVDGTLYLCLGKDNSLPLRPLLRDGTSDAVIEEAILEAIRHKPKRHTFEQSDTHIIRPMSALGG